MRRFLFAAALVLALLCLLFAAWALGGGGLAGALIGGAAPARPRRGPDPARSPHVVVDTLNLVHWLHGEALHEGTLSLTPALIAGTVARAAPVLKKRHKGQVHFVLKDRESQLNTEETRAVYQKAAKDAGVWVDVVEKYAEPPAGTKPTAEHSSRGRDDFYMSLLAWRLRCAVLTADRLRDFERFRATIPPFHVYEYAFWRERPLREFIRPDAAAYARVRKPKTVLPAEYFGEQDS